MIYSASCIYNANPRPKVPTPGERATRDRVRIAAVDNRRRRRVRMPTQRIPRDARISIRPASLKLRFQFKAALVFFEESAQIGHGIEQAIPLLVIKRHRETPQSVNADAAFFADAVFQAAFRALPALLFKFRDSCQ
jgi:hypothetical protein